MNKFNHFKRSALQLSAGLAIALFSFISVAYGGTNSLTKAFENTFTTVDCQAAFYTEAVESSINSSDVMIFHNFSEGDFSEVEWDFGDGTQSTSTAAVVSHSYAESGTYEVTLSIWDMDNNCYSVSSQNLTIQLEPDGICSTNSCVLPGDANNDGKADLNDLIHLGIGFGATGPVRPDATPLEWTPQSAPDWTENTLAGINYKHFDSDGNGLVDYQDISPMLYHYTPMKNQSGNLDKLAPKVYLDFEVDSVVVTEASESHMTLSAGIVMGSSSKPMEDIYGMALYFEYDSTLTEANQGVEINYNSNSFFGDQSEIITHAKVIPSHQQADVVLTRIDGQNISGYGRVATISFIVIIDVIGGRAEQSVPFNVPIKAITLLDKDGLSIPVSLEDKASGVIFTKETSTRVKENDISHQVNVFPNPATDLLQIAMKDLRGEYAQLYNTLGQLVKTHEFTTTNTSIKIDDLSPGVYLLKVQTDKGLANKRIVVE